MQLLNDMPGWLNGMLGQAAGVAVTYTRGATAIDITAASGQATVGRTAFASNRTGGARIEWGDRDYFIAAAAIAALGEPAEGDKVTETINGVECVFKVLLPNTGEPAWRWSDGETRTTYRLHVKQVG